MSTAILFEKYQPETGMTETVHLNTSRGRESGDDGWKTTRYSQETRDSRRSKRTIGMTEKSCFALPNSENPIANLNPQHS